MALGDGDTWDETTPTDGTQGIQIDDYIRDLRKGTRGRMAIEHEWPASQSATSQAGAHKFVTFQDQASKPTLAGTQVGAIYQKTSALYFENSAGVEIQITTGTSVVSDTFSSHFAIASGTATHGATLSLISGYSSSQVTCFVSVNDNNSANTSWDIDENGSHPHFRQYCSVDANRVVTCRCDLYTNGGGSSSLYGYVNYLMIGTK